MLKEYIKKLKNWVLEIFYPSAKLPENLRIHQTLFCPICRARQAEGKKVCHYSVQFQLGAATDYDSEAIRKMIWQLKYRNKTNHAQILASLLIDYLKSLKIELGKFLVLPMPLSQKRRRDRGYNQAELLAKIVAESFGLPLETGHLIRQKDAKPQMEVKDWQERRKNIMNCFGVANPVLIKNKSIILVDDVFTSGATMSEAVHALKDFGAKKIIGLVVAKAG